jgi:hypothetical protein
MRTRTLIQLVTVGAFLVGCGSTDERVEKKGAAEAKAIGCPSGSIIGGTVRQIKIDSKRPCLIIGVTVEQGIQVKNSSAVIMVENDVGDGIRVTGSVFVGIVNNRIFTGNLEVIQNGQVQVIDNALLDGDILVNGNDEADVNRNEASGDISCDDNGQLDSVLNHADGNEDCRG